ncbi:hypothetical protein OAE97_03775, partial [Verrucomicrobia bacterium]|nr:hypothetical protein [Verrucomicrobiota bacterium]
LAAVLLLLLWIVWCLQFVFRKQQIQIVRTVSGLLAGIPLVDMVAVVGFDPVWSAVMILLFVGALALQRFVPAT